ncbi:poly [ADP-ribose] polymerase 2 isoform X2 [Rhineura floridana]|uniref:poly [ADP-ribose] polymerase 2 isoform X2 n=1 Tax=Rhineura floridana TaxID=261503 RepID=UPI002AC7E8A4|nr:poly [ADP-ribose] polymerase 2 isoform X2 [Rhineura floridana]
MQMKGKGAACGTFPGAGRRWTFALARTAPSAKYGVIWLRLAGRGGNASVGRKICTERDSEKATERAGGLQARMGMGRKRKAPEAQKREPSTAGGELELRWEWETGSNGWQQFGPEQSDTLSQAARAGKLSADIGESCVDLRRMLQLHKQTGQETRVAAAVQDQDSYFVWSWQGDEQGEWFPYPADTCLDLQAARNGQGKPTVEVIVGRTRYKLDTTRMVQTNSRTGFERTIECRESDAAEIEDAGSQSSNNILGTKSPVPAKKARNKVDVPASQGEGDSKEAVKTLVVKGKAPVDPECSVKLGKAHVYYEGDDIYDVMLNQTNLQFNNNKYYLIQLLEDDGARNYSVWMRWGRVGKPGQHSLVICAGDLAKAKDVFTKKFLDKTKNEWSKRCNFQKVLGKYDLLHLDYEANDAGEEKAAPQKIASCPKAVSQLNPQVQALVELICNIRTMEEMVMEMKYDTKKAPLGKLTAEQICAGYQSLQKVEACLKRKQTGRALLEACNEFYTRIPHDFGLRTPPLISTEQELQEKAQLLEALGEIRIAIKLVRSEQVGTEHPLDRSYCGLACEIQPLERDGPDFPVLERYLLSTHAPTHQDYTMTLLEAFVLNKASSAPDFHSELPNRTLLWHGSRLGNWAGILSHGLRVAPPEAPVTGYMFGKGIYFADMSSKSANYCFATREKDIGLLLLSEVALGECNELLEANPEAEKLLTGKHSTKGLGKLAPSPPNCTTLNGALVPLGPAVETGVLNPHGYTLNYNEFIVYDPHQVRMKYLLKVRFNFTQLW